MDETLKMLINPDVVPNYAISVLQEVLNEGAEKGKTGWLDEPVEIHLEHLINHINKIVTLLARNMIMDENNEPLEEHVKHAFCRAMMMAVVFELTKSNISSSAQEQQEQTSQEELVTSNIPEPVELTRTTTTTSSQDWYVMPSDYENIIRNNLGSPSISALWGLSSIYQRFISPEYTRPEGETNAIRIGDAIRTTVN